MRISDLAECIQLAKTLSFTQTSKHFYISRSALTKHIAALEQEYDIVIFDRGPNGVTLTDAGARFIEGAERLMTEYGRFVETIDSVHRGSEKTIHITFLYGASFDLLGGVKTAFKEYYPNALLQFVAAEMTEVFDNIRFDRADFAVTSTLSLPDIDLGLYCWEPLYSDELMAMVPRGNPLFERESLSADDLRGMELLRMSTLIFAPDDPRPIAQFVRGVEDAADVRHDVYDLVASKFLMDTGQYIGLGMHHAAAFFGEDIRFIPIQEAQRFDCEVGALWKRSSDCPEISMLADIIRRQTKASPLRSPYAL